MQVKAWELWTSGGESEEAVSSEVLLFSNVSIFARLDADMRIPLFRPLADRESCNRATSFIYRVVCAKDVCSGLKALLHIISICNLDVCSIVHIVTARCVVPNKAKVHVYLYVQEDEPVDHADQGGEDVRSKHANENSSEP
jgi:hypothetical protein